MILFTTLFVCLLYPPSFDRQIKSPLARVNHKGPQVGKYGVDLTALEKEGIELMVPKEDTRIVIVDEIGKMECLSTQFTQTMQDILSNYPVVATIGEKGAGFMSTVKQHTPPDRTFTVTRANRNTILEEIYPKILDLVKSTQRQ